MNGYDDCFVAPREPRSAATALVIKNTENSGENVGVVTPVAQISPAPTARQISSGSGSQPLPEASEEKVLEVAAVDDSSAVTRQYPFSRRASLVSARHSTPAETVDQVLAQEQNGETASSAGDVHSQTLLVDQVLARRFIRRTASQL